MSLLKCWQRFSGFWLAAMKFISSTWDVWKTFLPFVLHRVLSDIDRHLYEVIITASSALYDEEIIINQIIVQNFVSQHDDFRFTTRPGSWKEELNSPFR